MAITIPDNDARVEYVASAGQTVFAYDFPISDEDHLVVLQNGTQLTITSHYTVSGVGVEAGGNVTLVSGATLNDSIIIYRDEPIARTSNFNERGDFRADTLNDQLNSIVRWGQQNERNISRAVVYDDSVTGITTASVGSPTDNAVLKFSGVTGSIVAGPTTTEIENAETNATAAAASAAAALVSEGLSEDWASKTDGIVDATDYSSKAYAIGGSGVTGAAGAAKEWAIKTTGTVDGSEYSAKAYAQQDLTGAAGGSAKDWAVTAEDVEVITGEFSAFHWAKKAEASAGGGLLKVSANDTTAGYLEDKLLIGTGLSLSTQNDGANETRTVSQNINGASSGTVASGDEILFSDIDDSNNIKKTTAEDVAALSAFSSQFLHIRDQRTSGTNGGASSAATNNVRTLNTVVTNEITGASLSSNRVTLPAGDYYMELEGIVRAGAVDRTRVLLYNFSDSADEVIGLSSFEGSTTHAYGRFSIASSKTFEVRQYTQTADTSGLGIAVSDGRVEVYCDLKIWKIG